MVKTNSTLTDDLIEKEWNLNDWKDKIQTYRIDIIHMDN